MCQLSLPGFDGPADALLTMVAQRKLAADQVPVADVTEQFLSHLTGSGELDLALAGELIAASARLMASKSAYLLLEPLDEDDEPAGRVIDEAQRLAYREAGAFLAGREGDESVAPPVPPLAIERRPQPRSTQLLWRAWRAMSERVSAPTRRLAVPAFVRLEVAVSRVIRALHSGSAVVFRQLVRGSSRQDTVVHFVAVLELLRQGRIRAEQPDLFGDITVQGTSDSAESASRAG